MAVNTPFFISPAYCVPAVPSMRCSREEGRDKAQPQQQRSSFKQLLLHDSFSTSPASVGLFSRSRTARSAARHLRELTNTSAPCQVDPISPLSSFVPSPKMAISLCFRLSATHASDVMPGICLLAGNSPARVQGSGLQARDMQRGAQGRE